MPVKEQKGNVVLAILFIVEGFYACTLVERQSTSVMKENGPVHTKALHG